MKLASLTLVLAACSFEHGALSSSSVSPDAHMIDGAPGCISFSSQLDTCTQSGTQDLTLTGNNTYDTTNGRLLAGTSTVTISRFATMGKAGPLEILLVHDLHLGANAHLRAVGNAPLAVIAYGSITLDTGSLIDASAGGSGARTSCNAGAIIGVQNGGGAGGGGGGGFGAPGGSGGTGDSDGTAAAGGTGGTAVPKPAGPLGGCPGARGGNGEDGGGPGGLAGGAIYLAAATRIDLGIGAGINVGGGGGGGGRVGGWFSNGDAGGGGGGSGGMIMLESPIVSNAGTLAANGGGGGEASGGGGSGNAGTTGLLSVDPAPGGSGDSDSGTDGGSGGAQAMVIGASVTAKGAGGGGGGGGGVGFIVVNAPTISPGVMSPAPI